MIINCCVCHKEIDSKDAIFWHSMCFCSDYCLYQAK